MQSLTLLKVYVTLSLKSLMAFRFQFVSYILHWIISLFINSFFWWIMFKHLPKSIGEWNFYDLCLLNSLCYISWGIFTIFWGFHLIPDKIINGQMDKFLCRPMSPLIGLIGEGFYPSAIYEIISGLGLVIFFMHLSEQAFSLKLIFLSSLAILMGTYCVILFHAIIALLSLWLGRINILQSMLHELDEFQRYPSNFFPKKISMLLKVGIPLYFPGTFACSILLEKHILPYDWILLIGLCCIFTLLFIFIYSESLKNYVSAN